MSTKHHEKIVPNGWRQVRLGDVADINLATMGNATPSAYEFRYLDLSGVDHGVATLPREYIKFSNAPSRARRIIKHNDVLMATVRPNLLGHCIVNFDPRDVICSTGFAVLHGKEGVLDNYYLYQYLFSRKLINDVNNLLVGSSYPAVNSSQVANLKLDLPPLPEQRRIVAILETWDKAIDLLGRQIEIRREARGCILEKLLKGTLRFRGFNESWQHTRLGDILEKIEGGGTPSKEREDFWNGSIPWASVKDIVTHNPRDTKDHISEGGLDNSSSRIIPKGTLIVPTRMALGHAVFFEVDVAINQDLKALYPKKILNKKFLYYWFKSKKRFIEKLGSGSTVSGLQQSELKSLRFELPSISEQDRIVSFLETWDREIVLLDKKLENLRSQKIYLLNVLMTGTIRTPKTDKSIAIEQTTI